MIGDLLSICATGTFTLAGFGLSAYIEAKKRKQQLLQTVFKKRVEVYTSLIELTHETIMLGLLNNSHQDVMNCGVKIINKFGSCVLFASAEVTELAITFGTTAAQGEMDFDKKQDQLASLHNKLRLLCQNEIGMHDLQCELTRKRT